MAQSILGVPASTEMIVLPSGSPRRPSPDAPRDAAFRLPDSAALSKRALAANAQMPSSGPRIADAR